MRHYSRVNCLTDNRIDIISAQSQQDKGNNNNIVKWPTAPFVSEVWSGSEISKTFVKILWPCDLANDPGSAAPALTSAD